MLAESCVVVFSGGQDSTTCLYWARKYFGKVTALTFDYGQRHRLEIDAAKKIAMMAEVDHFIVNVGGMLFSTSPLTSKADLEKYESAEHMAKVIGDRIELTFVPMRNTLFMTVAMNRAIALGTKHLVTGVCQEDNANYPDCTEEYVQLLEGTFRQSLADPEVKIHTPLMRCSKADTVRLSRNILGCWEALAYSHTSYDGKYPPTDMNHSNVLRAKGFQDAGYPDPLVLRAVSEGLMELPPTDNYNEARFVANKP